LVFSQLAASAGEAHLRLGHPDAAVALLEQAVEPKTFARGYKMLLPFVVLGETYLELDAVQDALHLAASALVQCDAHEDLPTKVWAQRLYGLIALKGRAVPNGSAADWFQRALELATELEMAPAQAHCRLGLGQALRQEGRVSESAAQFAIALSEYERMGMPYWLTRGRAIQAEG
jgi:tetratricopeptide (TPR) repeat protein